MFRLPLFRKASSSEEAPCQASWTAAISFSLLFVCAFLEVNFTTEGAQHHCRRDGCPAHGTYEGTSLFGDEPVVGFRLKRNLVLHIAPHGARAHVRRGGLGNRGVDIAAMAGQAVFSAAAEVAA